MRVKEQLQIAKMSSEISFLRIKNAKLTHFISKLDEKVDFYSDLDIQNEYDRGFNKAFEIMKNLLKDGV